MSNKQIFICKACRVEILEHQIHKPEECINNLQIKLMACSKDVDKWKNAWYDQRNATGRVAWQFVKYSDNQIKGYKESFAAAKK